MNLILFGAPGAGKGTQSQFLQQEFGITPVSTGALIREEITKKSDLGLQLSSIIKTGHYVSDDMVMNLVHSALSSIKTGIVFDGFPRTEAQAKSLIEDFHKKDFPFDAIIIIDVSEQDLLKRILSRYNCTNCGAIYNELYHPPKSAGKCDICQGQNFTKRADDTQETVKIRFQTYHQETKPMLNILEKYLQVIKVEGNKTPEDVHKEIKAKIKEIKNQQKVS